MTTESSNFAMFRCSFFAFLILLLLYKAMQSLLNERVAEGDNFDPHDFIQQSTRDKYVCMQMLWRLLQWSPSRCQEYRQQGYFKGGVISKRFFNFDPFSKKKEPNHCPTVFKFRLKKFGFTFYRRDQIENTFWEIWQRVGSKIQQTKIVVRNI